MDTKFYVNCFGKAPRVRNDRVRDQDNNKKEFSSQEKKSVCDLNLKGGKLETS